MQTVHISCPPRRGPALKLVWVSPYSNTIHAYHANWRAQHDYKTISLLIHLLHNGGPTNGLYTQSLPRCGPDLRSGLGYVVQNQTVDCQLSNPFHTHCILNIPARAACSGFLLSAHFHIRRNARGGILRCGARWRIGVGQPAPVNIQNSLTGVYYPYGV